MNNTLDINRFGKVLKHDGLNFFPRMILTLAILWAIPVTNWLFFSLLPGEEHIVDVFTRISFIGTLTNIALIIAPARLYKHCNDPRKGIGYAMLPASTLEKFLSMLIYCVIVTPIIYIGGALLVDTVLALISGPYDEFAVSYYFDRYAQINNYLSSNNNILLDDTWPIFFNSLSPTFMTMLSLFGTLMLSSIFMFGNMIFKRHKTGKMIGILILLFIIFMIVFINYVATHETMFEMMDEENAAEILKRIIFILMNASLYMEIGVSALLLWGTYRKIKTQKY